MREIPRIHQPSLEVFQEHYARAELPVILTGLTEGWAALHWTPRGIAERFKGTDVEVTPRHSEVEGTELTTIDEFVERLEQSDSMTDYLTSWCFRRDCPELLDDFDVPEYFREDWLEELPELNDMMWLFLGPKNSGMDLHQDLGHTAAWNAQVTGRKRWALVSPDFNEQIYEGAVSCFEPDFQSYPRFQEAVVWKGVVEAGEVLYIPGGWWHQTLNLETGFAITANYVDHTNYKRVLRCLEEYGETGLLQALSSLVKEKQVQ